MKGIIKNTSMLAVMAVALLPHAAHPQTPSSTFSDTVDVRLVNVEAVVTDREGVPVFGLGPQDGYVAELQVRIAASDERGHRSAVTTLPWRVTREQPFDGTESIEFATSLEMRRLRQDLVVAVYDTNGGALFSPSARVGPIS